MRYVGRHRAPRPLFLRRPVIAGVGAAVLLGGPAVAAVHTLGDQGPQLGAARQGSEVGRQSTPSPTDAVIVIPTDEVPTPPATTSPPTTQPTSRARLDVDRDSDDRGSTGRRRGDRSQDSDPSDPTKKPTTSAPTKTTTKPPAPTTTKPSESKSPEPTDEPTADPSKTPPKDEDGGQEEATTAPAP